MNGKQSNTSKRPSPTGREIKASQRSATFDYIVCGAGTSGPVVAARFAANTAVNVLLLEAGGSDDSDFIQNPENWFKTLGTEFDWGFKAKANSKLNGRAIPYSMGKVLRGGRLKMCLLSHADIKLTGTFLLPNPEKIRESISLS